MSPSGSPGDDEDESRPRWRTASPEPWAAGLAARRQAHDDEFDAIRRNIEAINHHFSTHPRATLTSHDPPPIGLIPALGLLVLICGVVVGVVVGWRWVLSVW